MKNTLLVGILTLGCNGAFAGSLIETFGSGANQFSMEFVEIGNANNAPDTNGKGSVSYVYNIGKYEVSRDMIDKANSEANLGITYIPSLSDTPTKPATGITWVEAAKFVNYLNTSTGGTAAYKFSGNTFQLWSSGDSGYDSTNLFRNSLSKFVLPNENEWVKAAYGGPDGTWNLYPTGDSTPTSVTSGTLLNTAVYGQNGVADVNNAGALSRYGTMAQGGNVFEAIENAVDGSNNLANEDRMTRGGSIYESVGYLSSGVYFGLRPTSTGGDFGLRVASVPEPSAFSLLAIGFGGLALIRRRK